MWFNTFILNDFRKPLDVAFSALNEYGLNMAISSLNLEKIMKCINVLLTKYTDFFVVSL